MNVLAGPMSASDVRKRLNSLPRWRVLQKGTAIRADYKIKDFITAVGLIVKIARVAEKADHHPDLHLTGYRRLAVVLTTHSVGRLSPKDFALAKKIDALF